MRIISATHRDLPKAMEKKSFREDLYYRLNVVNLRIPALHERAEDIPLLANHLLRQSADRQNRVRSFGRCDETAGECQLGEMCASWST